MIAVRIMSPEGEERFRNYIHNLRADPSTLRPDLNEEPFSSEFSPRVLIDETNVLSSKMRLAEYLQECFKRAGLRREDVFGRRGLWTWLAYIWFDQLAPIKSNTGMRAITEDAKYICSSDYRDYYRHLVAGPYMIYSLHGPDNSRIFLYNPVYEHNDFIEQFASRQFIISHRNIVEAISWLYLNPVNNEPRRGAQSRNRPGNIRRFVRLIQQFELTYDVYTMSPDQILDLLPAEFNEWRPGR